MRKGQFRFGAGRRVSEQFLCPAFIPVCFSRFAWESPHRVLAAVVDAASQAVAVANPSQMRDVAKSTEQLARVDRPDARIQAHIGWLE